MSATLVSYRQGRRSVGTVREIAVSVVPVVVMQVVVAAVSYRQA